MSTLVFNHEEITARELKPRSTSWTASHGSPSRRTSKLYQLHRGAERDSRQLDGVDLSAANQVYSDIRALKVDLTFAIGGIKNHEIYFEHLGGDGVDPDGPFEQLVERDFGSVGAWRDDLKATGMAGRGWAWTAYDWDEGRLFNYIGDTQNSSDLERDAARRPRRLRARLLRLPDLTAPPTSTPSSRTWTGQP